MVTPNPLRLPTPSELYDALTITLGQFSGCEPGIAIHMERLFYPTLDRFGIGEDRRREYEAAALLYPPAGKPHAPSLWRKFNLAFRYMKDGCVQGEALPRMYQDCARYYKLTPHGAQRALELVPLYDADIMEFFLAPPEEETPRENLTLLWFTNNWSTMQPRVRAYLARHLERSETMGLSDDHISTFVERAIRRDSFHDHLAAGNKIYPSTLCNFVARSAYTEMRGWGSDGACRAIRGAMNERDRRKAAEFHEKNPDYASAKVFSKEHTRSSRGLGVCSFEGQEEGLRGGAMLDTFGGDLEAEVLGMINMEQTMAQISSVLDSRLPEPDKHFQVFVMKEVDGMTYREIARNQDIPESRATTMVKKVRQTLRDAADSGEIEMPH